MLLVEDDKDARDATEQLLSLHGARVRAAGSSDEALLLFGGDRPDVVLTDLAMPGGDGFSLMAALRHADVPVVAYTAFSSPETRARVRESGFALQLTKPVVPYELVTALGMAASNRATKFADMRTEGPEPWIVRVEAAFHRDLEELPCATGKAMKALAPYFAALERDPLAFPTISRTQGTSIRVCDTDPMMLDGCSIPPLRVFFVVDEQTEFRRVQVLTCLVNQPAEPTRMPH